MKRHKDIKSGIYIKIKPMSVNEAWQGKGTKSDAYKSYADLTLALLPPELTIPDAPLTVSLTFGVSHGASIADNNIRPFIEILQQKHSLKSSNIFRYIVDKVSVKKLNEYIMFDITPWDHSHLGA